MHIENFIETYDNVLPKKVLCNLIRYCNVVDFEKASILQEPGSESFETVNFNVRKTYIKPLLNIVPSMTEVHWTNLLTNRFNECYSKYLHKFSPQSHVAIQDIQILKYEKGGFYEWHVDHCTQISRTLSAIYILNNDYEGGNLCFKFGDEEKVMDVVPNRIIVWPSNFMYLHTVKPVTKGTRYSIVSWAL